MLIPLFWPDLRSACVCPQETPLTGGLHLLLGVGHIRTRWGALQMPRSMEETIRGRHTVGEPFWVCVERASPPENVTCEQKGEQSGGGLRAGGGQGGRSEPWGPGQGGRREV